MSEWDDLKYKEQDGKISHILKRLEILEGKFENLISSFNNLSNMVEDKNCTCFKCGNIIPDCDCDD